MDNLIPLVTRPLGPEAKFHPHCPCCASCVPHPPRHHHYVWRGLWEGGKYKAPLSTRGKGKGMGPFPKVTSEILPGGKRALPPPGVPDLRLPSLLGRLTGLGVSLGLSLPINATEETFQAFLWGTG